MGVEIEYKFLVDKARFEYHLKQLAGLHGNGIVRGVEIKQSYFNLVDDKQAVRVRTYDDEEAWLCIKADIDLISRHEFEYHIPVRDARVMMEQLCEYDAVTKTRYKVPVSKGALVSNWEVDVFSGDNEGLITAEIELDTVDSAYVIPGWLGLDVTGQTKYLNSSLYFEPFEVWNENSDSFNL